MERRGRDCPSGWGSKTFCGK